MGRCIYWSHSIACHTQHHDNINHIGISSMLVLPYANVRQSRIMDIVFRFHDNTRNINDFNGKEKHHHNKKLKYVLIIKVHIYKRRSMYKSVVSRKNRSFLRDKISARQLAVFSRGTNVGILARDCYPGGLDMSPKSPKMFGK